MNHLYNLPVTQQHLALPSGITLAYAEFGDPAGPPVLFIHGFTDTAASWLPVLPFLQRHYRLILPDLRGHGGSSRPETGYARADLAADLLALIDALGLDRVDLVGHSLGSLVAQTIATTWPERVRRVVLISSTATPEPGAESFDLAGALARLADPIDPDGAFMLTWFDNPNPVEPAFLAAARQQAARMPSRLWRQILAEALDLNGLSAALPRRAAPALLIWGGLDPLFGQRHRASLCRALPEASVQVYDNLGHNPFWEAPDAIAAAIAEFLDRPQTPKAD